MAGAGVHHQPEHGETRFRPAELHYGRTGRARRLAQEGHRNRGRHYGGHCRGRRRFDHRHPPPWLAHQLRRRSHSLDRSSGNGRPTDPPAFSLDFWHAAILLEARRHAAAPKIRNARLDRAAQHLFVPACPAAYFAGYRPDVLWLAVALGTRAVPRHAVAATLDRRGRGKIGALLSWILAH